jgi:hypothetical protein
MTSDPRWLEILKASGWRPAALAAGSLLWADRADWIPALEPWMVQAAAVVMIACGLLALASFASNAVVHIDQWSGSIAATAQLHPFNAGGIPNFVQRAGRYQGLKNKKIVSITAADPQGRIQTITIESAARKKLTRKFKA